MKNHAANRLALSNVVAVLIILVITVLLATIVTSFSCSTANSRTKDDSLRLTMQHIWVNPNSSPSQQDYAQAAVMVVNTAGKDTVIERLCICGQDCPWDDVTTQNGVTTGQFIEYYVKPTPISGDLQFQTNFNAGPSPAPTDNHVTLAGQDCAFKVATGELAIKSGYTIVLYIINPPGITIDEMGMTISVTVFTSQAVFSVETNVQGVSSSH